MITAFVLLLGLFLSCEEGTEFRPLAASAVACVLFNWLG